MRALFLICLLFVSSSFAQEGSTLSSSGLASTSNTIWLSSSRAKQLESVLASLQEKANQDIVRQNLGEPQSIQAVSNETVWTYGINRHHFFHVVLDAQGQVLQTTNTIYRNFSDKDLVETTNIAASSHSVVFDIGSWRVMSQYGFPFDERVQMAAAIVQSLPPNATTNKVQDLLGPAASVVERQYQTAWTYRIGPGTFLQILFLENKTVLGAYLRHYDHANGRLNLIPIFGETASPQAMDLDVACWKATFPKYAISTERTSIGRRMAYFLKEGMTRAFIVEMLGEPFETGKLRNLDCSIYPISPSSKLIIMYDSQGVMVQFVFK